MSEEIVEMTRAQVEAATESGDTDLMYKVMTGNIKIVSPQEFEKQQQLQEPAQEPSQQLQELVQEPSQQAQEPINDKLPPVDPNGNPYIDMIKSVETKYESQFGKLEERNKDLEEKIKEWETKYEELKTNANKPVEQHSYQVPVFNDTPEDEEMATTYSKNNREVLRNISENLQNAVTKDQLGEVINKLNNVIATQEKIANDAKRESDANSQETYLNNLFTEVDLFAKSNKDFALNKGVKERYQEHNKLRDRVAGYLRTEDDGVISKTIRGIVGGVEAYKSVGEELKKVGIEIPDDTANYLKLSELVELKAGRQYNPTTGLFEDILDDFGHQICQRSIEDAYKLSTYASHEQEVREEQSIAIQNQLNSRAAGAVRLPDSSLNTQEEVSMSQQDIIDILNTPDSEIKKNPELQKKFNAAYEQYFGKK